MADVADQSVAEAAGPGRTPVESSAALSTGTQVVVGAAILRQGMLLAACRSGPAALAGLWELPGGKVEPGELEADAVVRECREELGVDIRVLRRLAGEWPLDGPLRHTHVLHVWVAELVEGDPQAGDSHRDVRWLAPGDWHGVRWLPADLPVLAALRRMSEVDASPHLA